MVKTVSNSFEIFQTYKFVVKTVILRLYYFNKKIKATQLRRLDPRSVVT